MARILPKNKIKPLFIGFGNQALEYAKAFAYYNINIEAVCVNNLDKNKKKISKFKIKNKFDSINKALSSKCYNCVFVFLPWNMIEKKIINILKNTKKNVFCEKPLALSYSKIIKIKKVSNIYNKKLFILYNRRYYETLNYLKKKLKNIHEAEILIPENAPANIRINPDTVPTNPSVNSISDANQPGSCRVSKLSNFGMSLLANLLNCQLSYPQ